MSLWKEEASFTESPFFTSTNTIDVGKKRNVMVTWEHGKCYKLIKSLKEIDNFLLKIQKQNKKLTRAKYNFNPPFTHIPNPHPLKKEKNTENTDLKCLPSNTMT